MGIRLVLFTALLALPFSARAENDIVTLPGLNEVTETTSVGMGFSSSLNSYLSPVRYGGISGVIEDDRLKKREEGSFFSFLHTFSSIGFSPMRSSNDVNSTLQAYGRFYTAWDRPLASGKGWMLMAGPSAMFDLSVLYAMSNSNNPVNAVTQLSLGLTADAMYGFRFMSRCFVLNGSASLPVAGVGFAPEYDQLYWLMYSDGSYGKAIHFITPFNYRLLTCQFALSAPVMNSRIKAGVDFDCNRNRLGSNVVELDHMHFTLGIVHVFERKKWK